MFYSLHRKALRILLSFAVLATIFMTPAMIKSVHADSIPPVLFVHGIDSNSSADCNEWSPAINYLESPHDVNGLQSVWTNSSQSLIKIGFYSNDQNCDVQINFDSSINSRCKGYYDDYLGYNQEHLQHIACELAWYIWNNYTSQGQTVDIVAHSMGGLLVRFALYATQNQYYQFPPNLDIHNVITFDSPLEGLPTLPIIASLLCNQCNEAQEMQQGSLFMDDLTNNDESPQGEYGTNWTIMGSSCQPTDLLNWMYTTTMPGASQYVFGRPCYGHGDFLHATSDNYDAQITENSLTTTNSGPHPLHLMLYALEEQSPSGM